MNALDYLNPKASGKEGFWGTKLAQMLSDAQNYVRGSDPVRFTPTLQNEAQRNTAPIPQPILQALQPAQGPISAVQHGAEGLVNGVSSALNSVPAAPINTALDVANIATGHAPVYNDLRSPLTKLSYGLASSVDPSAMQGSNSDTSLPGMLGNYAGAAAPYSLLAGGGLSQDLASPTMLGRAVKGAVAAGKGALPYSALSGVESAKAEKNVPDWIRKTLTTAAISELTAMALGGGANALRGAPVGLSITGDELKSNQELQQLSDTLANKGKVTPEEAQALFKNEGVKNAYEEFLKEDPGLRPKFEDMISRGDVRGPLTIIAPKMDETTRAVIGDMNRADAIGAGKNLQDFVNSFNTGGPVSTSPDLVKAASEAQNMTPETFDIKYGYLFGQPGQMSSREFYNSIGRVLPGEYSWYTDLLHGLQPEHIKGLKKLGYDDTALQSVSKKEAEFAIQHNVIPVMLQQLRANLSK